MDDKLLELRKFVLTMDEKTQMFNKFFSTTKTKDKLLSRYDNLSKKKSTPSTWTEMQCKELLIEMEKPGTMKFKIMAERSIFNGKDDNQLREKTVKLRSKKSLFLSAAATQTGENTVNDFPTGAEPST